MSVSSINQDTAAAVQVSVLKQAMDHALQKSTQLIESGTKPANQSPSPDEGVGKNIDVTG